MGRVIVFGLKRTRERIVRRELNLPEGQKIAIKDTALLLAANADRVFNTRLFTFVRWERLDENPDTLNLIIKVNERFYTIPEPIFELADRSFNEWYYNRGADFNRVNFGLRLTQNNLTGNNDFLRGLAQTGFTRKAELTYSFPYLNRKQTLGMRINGIYNSQKESNVRTVDNKQVFYQNLEAGAARIKSEASVALFLRKGFYAVHNWEIGYSYNQISDEFASLNPDYLVDGNTRQRYVSLSYGYTLDHRDRRNFALNGYLFSLNAEQLGGILSNDNINISSLHSTVAYYRSLGSGWFTGGRLDGEISAPRRQPYNQWHGLGYNNRLVRGFDKYVIEGSDSWFARAVVRKRVFSKVFHANWIPIQQFKSIPFDVYWNTFADAGGVHNQYVLPENLRLTNKVLSAVGTGLSIVTYYDVVLRTEYSYNSIGQGNFFIYLVTDI